MHLTLYYIFTATMLLRMKDEGAANSYLHVTRGTSYVHYHVSQSMEKSREEISFERIDDQDMNAPALIIYKTSLFRYNN